jgi:TonB family protein
LSIDNRGVSGETPHDTGELPCGAGIEDAPGRPMLRPDPMRFARADPIRVNGPEWIESDPPEPDSTGSDRVGSMEVLAFRRAEGLPPDLALDLRLHEILEDALRSAAATGAMIALASGDKMVCRATAGEKVPSIGSFLNTRSGLSGLCVQTREMQRCDDTLIDSRVNAEACRILDVRSIVVLPVVEGTRLWGILEIFSSRPRAFSDADVPDLQALGRRVSHTVREAVEGGSESPAPDPLSVLANSHKDPAETEAREILKSGLQDPSLSRRDYRTGALTAAVIALAVLLGWMVGRVGWSISMNRSGTQLPANPTEMQTTSQGTRRNATATVETSADSKKPTSLIPVPSPESNLVAKPSPELQQTTTERKTDVAEPAGGLVVYEQGKVVFRMPPPKAATSGGESDPAQPAEGGDVAVSRAAGHYLLKRVEPTYPEEARIRHIEGPVVLNALVGTDGAVRELNVVSGDPLLAKAAVDAVRQWRFQPHRENRRLVEFENRITVNFALP